MWMNLVLKIILKIVFSILEWMFIVLKFINQSDNVSRLTKYFFKNIYILVGWDIFTNVNPNLINNLKVERWKGNLLMKRKDLKGK